MASRRAEVPAVSLHRCHIVSFCARGCGAAEALSDSDDDLAEQRGFGVYTHPASKKRGGDLSSGWAAHVRD